MTGKCPLYSLPLSSSSPPKLSPSPWLSPSSPLRLKNGLRPVLGADVFADLVLEVSKLGSVAGTAIWSPLLAKADAIICVCPLTPLEPDMPRCFRFFFSFLDTLLRREEDCASTRPSNTSELRAEATESARARRSVITLRDFDDEVGGSSSAGASAAEGSVAEWGREWVSISRGMSSSLYPRSASGEDIPSPNGLRGRRTGSGEGLPLNAEPDLTLRGLLLPSAVRTSLGVPSGSGMLRAGGSPVEELRLPCGPGCGDAERCDLSDRVGKPSKSSTNVEADCSGERRTGDWTVLLGLAPSSGSRGGREPDAVEERRLLELVECDEVDGERLKRVNSDGIWVGPV